MRVLVTGAHGLLGRSLVQEGAGFELITCGRREEPVGPAYHRIDLADGAAVESLIAATAPDWVIHTAAWTDVDGCEADPDRARRVNLELVRALGAACSTRGTRLVQLSTDYVFDGRGGPYSEADEPNPLSHYGRIKLESEGVVLGGDSPGLVVRTLWLYGHAPGVRRNLVTWPLRALARGAPLRIADDQWGNPTFATDLARAILDLCKRNCRGLYHVGGADFMTRLKLVEELASTFGFDTGSIVPTPTAEIGQLADRPLRSGLKTGENRGGTGAPHAGPGRRPGRDESRILLPRRIRGYLYRCRTLNSASR